MAATRRMLELTLISAKDLEEVNLYAVVSLSGNTPSRKKVQADRTGGCNPTWNATLRFAVPATGESSLHILLRAKRTFRDRDVGEVNIPLSELLSRAPDSPVAYKVRKIASSEHQGDLNLSYKLGEVTQSASGPGAGLPFRALLAEVNSLSSVNDGGCAGGGVGGCAGGQA